MEKIKKYWKSLAVGLGVSALSLAYIFYKKGKGKPSNTVGKEAHVEGTPLKKSEAMHRATLIKNLKYTLFLQLRSDSILATKNVYEGATSIEFDLNTIEDIFLDFTGNVKKVVINGEDTLFMHKNDRIYLPKEKLVGQGNKVFIYYVNHYANESNGIRHYIDPEDGNPYVYTNFEPFYAHTMFPCFDQPNLKAPIKLFVACPNDWTVMSATPKLNSLLEKSAVLSKEKDLMISTTFLHLPQYRNSFSLHEFETTAAIATYTFAVCAGTFAEIEDFAYDKSEKLPPFKIYCRSFIQNTVESFNIFKTAKESLKWYKENLTSVIPDAKIDLVFVPSLKIVAMENVGCITFDDGFLEPSQTPIELAYFHYLIAHELAHIWFGNYITPEWWDDLWLNESFATFLAYLCLKQVSERIPKEMGEFNNMWLLFNKHKAKGIIYDQYRTTHKIRDTVEDTAHALTMFDQITYYKGAAILKYYYFVAGHELFFKGLKNYIDKFYGKNANYDQFKEILRSLSETRHIKTPLEIIEPFLDNTGVIRIDRVIKYNNLTYIDEFNVTQTPCSNATFEKYYNFRMNVLLIYPDREVILNDISFTDKHVSRISELEKIERPSAVVLNAGDWAYFKQTFDDASRDYLIENCYKIKDPVTRLVVSRDLFEMIREGLLDVETYLHFTLNLLKQETEEFIIVQVLKSTIHAVTNFVEFDYQEKHKESLFELIRENLFFKHKAIRKTLINFLIDLINFANDKEIGYLINFLKKDNERSSLLRGNSGILDSFDLIGNFDLSYMDEATKFRLLETIAESDVLSKDEKKKFEKIIISIETSNSRNISPNNSYNEMAMLQVKPTILTGHRLETLTLEACRPVKSLKAKLWEMFVYRDAELLDEEYEAYMKGFARKSQFRMLKDYYKIKFFEDIIYVKNYFGENYAVIFFKNLNPSFVISEKVLKSFIDLSKKVGPKEYKLRAVVEKSKV